MGGKKDACKKSSGKADSSDALPTAAERKKERQAKFERKKARVSRSKAELVDAHQKGSRRSSEDDDAAFALQMSGASLRIAEMASDGNCLFRAIGDQLEGRPQDHARLRELAMDYVAEHGIDFSPFIEDDEAFDDYVCRLRRDKVWAGNLELVALSKALKCNIRVHQLAAPSFLIAVGDSELGEGEPRMLHLSYHGECHYNSVRRADDHKMDCAPAVIEGLPGVRSPTRAADQSRPGLKKPPEAQKADEEVDGLAGEAEPGEADAGQLDRSAKAPVTTDVDVGPGVTAAAAPTSLFRNRACACGSKKKSKNCCAARAAKAKANQDAVEPEPNVEAALAVLLI